MIPLKDRNYSPYRLKDAREWLAKGFADFVVVESLTGQFRSLFTPQQVAEEMRKYFVVVCRPATSGGWRGKRVQYRVKSIMTINLCEVVRGSVRE